MNEIANTQSAKRIKAYLLLGLLCILIIKLLFAFILDLYSDEIFYWQASQFPAIAYSDLPFMAALLSGLGTAVFGNSAIAVRALFLVLGTSIPILVYWLASPLLPRRQALEAAGLSLCLPLCAFLGLLAVPDVPLLFFGLLFIGSLERATRLNEIRFWIAAGVAAALGVSTHYRFALYLLAAFFYLCAFPANHRYWTSPSLWLAAAILALGLYPMLSFNLGNQLSGIDYHLLERHPWEFQAEGLLHVFKQAILVTPLLYLALAITLYRLLLAARRGDRGRGLFGLFAVTNLGVYLILAPWTDSTRTSIHWPLSGYLPLLVFLPETLRVCFHVIARRYNEKVAQRIILATVVLGFSGSLIALFGVGSQSLNAQLTPLLGKGILSNKMAGWKPLNRYVDSLISSEHFGPEAIITTDNYYTGAQLALGLQSTMPIFNIDEDKAIRDGRAVQYQIWQLNGAALESRESVAGLFISEDSALTVPDKIAIMQRACGHFGGLTFLSQFSQFNGEKVFSFYRGDGRSPSGTDSTACPMPTLGWVDQPVANAHIDSVLNVTGWAINEGQGLASISVLLDGEVIGEANYGLAREDVVAAMKVQTDPNAPNLGFDFSIPTSQLPQGRAVLSLRAEGMSGEVQIFGVRTIELE